MDKNFSQVYKINTKEYWRNYWFYYRTHTLVAIAALIVIGFSVHGCMTRVDPDFSILYIGKTTLMPAEPAEPKLEQYISDVNGDGKKSVNITNLSIGDEKDAQMTQASVTKADLELSVGNPSLFVCDQELIDRYVQMQGLEEIADITAAQNVPDDRLLKDEDGDVVAVNVTGTAFAKMIGYIGQSKVYAGVKVMPMDKKGDKKYIEQHQEVVRMYEFILKDKFE